jgi:murein L,D-transpeptidase YafK
MWQGITRFVIFQCKALQFRYNTWKTHRAIVRAYREKGLVGRVLSLATRHVGLLSLVGAALVIAVVVTAGIGPLMRAGGGLRTSVSHAPSQARHAVRSDTMETGKKAGAPAAATAADSAQKTRKTEAESAAAGYTPAPSSAEPMLYCLLANKATRALYLLQRNAGETVWSVAQQYPAVMGRNDGQKQSAGDRRTPEGLYFIIGRKDKSELSQIYGPCAYVLNYPNEDDRLAGRTGQGIWIHGMPEDSSRMMTRGCIVLENPDLLALSAHLQLGIGTPVVIIDNRDVSSAAAYPDYGLIQRKREIILQEYGLRQREFSDLLNQWKSAWESRNIERYSSFYDSGRFSGGGLTWPAWREKKQRLFETYSTIELSLDRIKVVDFSESTAVVVFLQQYATDVSKKQNAKKLSFIKADGRWKIYREDTFSNEELFL